METIYLADILSEVTRKKRRSLLIAAIVGIAMSVVGLVPTKIEAIGLTFSPSNLSHLLILVAAIIAYYLYGYLIYYRSDYKAWELKLEIEVRAERMQASDDEVMRPEREARYQSANADLSVRAEHYRVLIGKEISERLKVKKQQAKRISTYKRLYDFWLPLIVSVLTVISLLYKALIEIPQGHTYHF
jgi:hypothetical protein